MQKMFQQSNKSATENNTQRLDRKQILTLRTRMPPVTPRINAATGNDIMNVRMQIHLLTPGVQYANTSNLGTKILFVTTKTYQRIFGRLEKQVVHLFGITQTKGIQADGNRENSVEIRAVKY